MGRQAKVLHIVELTKNRNEIVDIVQQLGSLLLFFRVEDENKNGAKVIHEGSREDFI